MNKKTFKLRRRIPLLTMGLLGIPFAADLMFSSESFMPKAEAFTDPVNNQVVNGETVTSGGVQNINDGGIANNTTVDGTQNVTYGGMTEGTVINFGGRQEVYAGGNANSTIIGSSGMQNINSGGIATGSQVTAGGHLIVNDGGISKATQINGGTEDVSGGTSYDSELTAGTQNILSLGISYDTRVTGGDQYVYIGGEANRTQVSGSAAAQHVSSNGVANDTVVSNDGKQYVNYAGTVNDTIINDGWQEINYGGVAERTTVNSLGTQTINDGGIANNSTINTSGRQFVNSGGIANDTLVDDGWQYIHDGGEANRSILDNGAEQQVDSGGKSNGTIVNAESIQFVDGVADNTTVFASGVQYVWANGVSNDTTVNTGGLQSVMEGTANDTIVKTGGTQYVYGTNGTSYNAVLDGGEQYIWSEGVANGTIIEENGVQHVEGGTSNSTVVNENGVQFVYSGGVSNNTTVYDGTINIVENGTQLTGTTTLNGGSLYLLPASVDGTAFITSDIENIAGDGSIYLNTNLEALTGDLIRISGSISGEQQVFANNQGGASVDKDQTLTIIETAGGGNFSLGQQVEVGGYLYDLRQNPGNQNNWELYSPGSHTSSANASINAFAGGYLLNYAETQTLLQRMGDLRQGDNQGGVWARVFGGKFESNGSSFLSGFDMSYSGLQVGADKKLSLKNGKGDLYVGGMFGYSKGNLEYQTGHGSIDSKTLGAYGTYLASSGFYADLALKYGWMKNDFKVLDTAGDRVTGKDMNTDGLSASLEVGQKIHFNKTAKEGWYLEPQAQISMGHQSGGSFNASNGLRVDVDSYTSTLGRLGINAGYEMKSGKNPINVYGKVSYVHEFDGDVGYRMNGISEQTSFGDSWWTYGVGITAQLNKKHNVYLDIERASGGQFDQPWSVNGGYRFNW